MTPSVDTPMTATAGLPEAFTASSHGERPLLVAYSARVKAVDVHPTEPWVLSATYDGTVVVHNLDTNAVIKTFSVSVAPVRTAKFVARMNWIATGSDDRKIRVFKFDTNELVAEFEAHEDYVRSLDVHSRLPLLLSCGDDHAIKAWDWTQNWSCVRQLAGHRHYVMAIAVSASGTTVATASLDHDVRLWQIDSLDHGDGGEAALTFGETGVFTPHTRGLNAVAFDASATQLVTASDDHTVRVWDLATKQEHAVLNGHTGNVTSVCVHPTLPLIVSGAEDGTVRLWNSETFRCVGVFAHGLGRTWALALVAGRNAVAIGYDRGSVVVALPSSIVSTPANDLSIVEADSEGYVAVTEA